MACGDEPEPCALTLSVKDGQASRYTFDVARGEALKAKVELGLSGACPGLTGEGQPERGALHLKGFQVKIDVGQIPGQASYAGLLDFSEPISGILPGTGVVTLIPAQLAKKLESVFPQAVGKVLIMISVEAMAKLSGQDLSATIVVPVDLCKGCLTK